MANAARVHAVENGKNISDHGMIAFGGAAPLHAARLCEKLNIGRCIIPEGAGVGSAIGFLRAPFGYEAVASQISALSDFDPARVNALLEGLKDTAEHFVLAAVPARSSASVAFMRYRGQGWEIPVELPDRAFTSEDRAMIRDAFRDRYAGFFGRAVDGPEIEFVTFSVKAQDRRPEAARIQLAETGTTRAPATTRKVFDPAAGRALDTAIFARDALSPGERIPGPAVIAEAETSTVVTSLFDAVIQPDRAILLLRKEAAS